jgi:hypothetical protein
MSDYFDMLSAAFTDEMTMQFDVLLDERAAVLVEDFHWVSFFELIASSEPALNSPRKPR